jgi:gliding motility-associated-like protein
MKTPGQKCPWLAAGRGSFVSALSVLFTYLSLSCIIAAGSLSKVLGQDIAIRNPSLEGVPKEQAVPPKWSKCGISPDLQPGFCGIRLAPSDGDSYVSLQSAADWHEGISQTLPEVLKAGRVYTISFDLAYPPSYYGRPVASGSLVIYAGASLCDEAQELWRSEVFYHTGWKRYTAVFKPSRNYRFISFRPYFKRGKKGNVSAVLIDNLSPSIREMPQLGFSVLAACPGESNGAARVQVRSGEGPFKYRWTPGNFNTEEITGLPAGGYEVTVRAANGTETTGKVFVPQSNLKSHPSVVPAGCNGSNESLIVVNTTGGLPPYRYYLNRDNYPSYTNVFRQLMPGAYDVVVVDEQGCSNRIDGIEVTEPLPLHLQHVMVEPSGCSSASDGKIIPLVSGGVPPYEYRLDNDIWQPDSVIHNLKAGSYYFEIRDGARCSVKGLAEVTSKGENCLVVMPNAFSPNNDGNNDIFRPKVFDQLSNYELRVYNRWGNLIFRTNDPRAGWDGTYKGAPQTAQAYIYTCSFTNNRQERQELNGTVLLLR